jgi:hypothetical protein
MMAERCEGEKGSECSAAHGTLVEIVRVKNQAPAQ